MDVFEKFARLTIEEQKSVLHTMRKITEKCMRNTPVVKSTHDKIEAAGGRSNGTSTV